MVDVPRFCCLRHHAQPQSFVFSDEVIVNGAGSEEHRQRNIVFIHAAVAQDDEILPFVCRTLGVSTQFFKPFFCTVQSVFDRKQRRERDRLKRFILKRTKCVKFVIEQERAVDLYLFCMFRRFTKPIAP